MRRALTMLLVASLLLAACTSGGVTTSETPQANAPAAVPTVIPPQRTVRPRPAPNLPWGGTAHLEVARSTSCADLQSWFDAADFQRGVLLDRMGPDDPGYRYAFDLMLQADERMASVGCY